MTRIPSGRHQPNILRTPDKKPADFRATNQSQSNAGTYDERGGGSRTKKIVGWSIALILAVVVVTTIVDAIAGRTLL